MLPKSRVRILKNLIVMYSNIVLNDQTLDGFYVEKYSSYLNRLKEKFEEHDKIMRIEQEIKNQLKLFWW